MHTNRNKQTTEFEFKNTLSSFRNTAHSLRHYIEHLFIGENKKNRHNGFVHVARASLL